MADTENHKLTERLKNTDPALLRLVAFVGAMVLVLVILIKFDQIFLPLLLGLTVSYLLDPAVSWFERRGRSRVTGVIVISAVLILLVVGFFLYLVPTAIDQGQRLAKRLPQYEQRLEEQIGPLMTRLRARYPEELETLNQKVREAITSNLDRVVDVAGFVGKRLRNMFGNLLQLFLFLLNLVFVPVFAFYMLVDWPKIKRGALNLVPVPYRETVLERVGEVNQAVAGFVRGQLTIAMVLAAINAIGLMIIGVPFGLMIGIIAGLANMIPYMALVVGLTPALVLCWAEFQSWPRLLAVVAVFGGAQLLEGTVLSPRILSGHVNLHPVWVLLSVIAGGSLFGFFGMLIAVPTAAAIQVFVRHWLELYRSSRIYRAEGS